MNSRSSSAPATQPVHSAMFSFTAAGSPSRTMTSLTRRSAARPEHAKRLREHARLSPERLITQFEMITSTVFDGSGIASMWPLRNSTFVAPAFSLFSSASASISSVMSRPYALPVGPDAPRREQDVDAAARAEVEDRLAFVQLGERRRVAAAERREQRLGGKAGGLAGVVEIGGDRIPRLARRAATAARSVRRAATARAACAPSATRCATAP